VLLHTKGKPAEKHTASYKTKDQNTKQLQNTKKDLVVHKSVDTRKILGLVLQLDLN